MDLVINGQSRSFPELPVTGMLTQLVDSLALKGDRIAIEHNGTIIARPLWATTPISSGDRMEIVHFVGGGMLTPASALQFRES